MRRAAFSASSVVAYCRCIASGNRSSGKPQGKDKDSSNSGLVLESRMEIEKLPESDVQVANLPAKEAPVTPFDEYKRSTTEFTSLVSPHGIVGVGLGAGFGITPDKRFGFLRPRKTLQPRGGELTPKFDENGLPIETSQDKKELVKKKLEYLRSFQGTTLSSREHFLLVDLDFDKDSILFGSTREEFEANVKKLKQVILTYQRWERSDNFYYYSTIVLKLLTLWIVMECAHQYAELQLLASNYSIFADAIENELTELKEKRDEDFRKALEELVQHPPKFKELLKLIAAEKERVHGQTEKRDTPSSSTQPMNKRIEESRGVLSPSAEDAPPSGSEVDGGYIHINDFYKVSKSHHPMDTTGEARYREKKMEDERQLELERFKKTSEASSRGYLSRLYHYCLKRMRRRAGLEKEDIALYLYAASPTSVETIRQLRRLLLPRSEDLTQIVREEMVAYKNLKNEMDLKESVFLRNGS